ncbi:hypothetical protein GA0074692_4973 [Micromonospora pallida]|uniref:Uncharacterized protein n=1 Tax=Micromonospora pallida TaxID=145854 RepID=A0A1C6T9R6_9ACTN|nr:hypothetical protein [Micromonospora pallida]SCL38322.1 hypothetical protein GA0074692_4973 [Micromonospora pallida]
MAGAKPAGAEKKPSKAAHIWLALISVVIVGSCVAAGIVNGGSDTTVPPPTAQERADTVPILARSTASQGICYGWKLEDYGYDPISVGSNLGDGVSVEDNVNCPRWLQVEVLVYYASASSESEDSARITVTGSEDIQQSILWHVDSGLTRMGLEHDVFVDDPGWATTRAATVLPLLAVEAELVEPAAAPAPAGAAPAPLPAAGNDLWRDRWAYGIAVAALLLITALLVTVGLVQRHRQRQAAAETPAATSAGRTRNKP